MDAPPSCLHGLIGGNGAGVRDGRLRDECWIVGIAESSLKTHGAPQTDCFAHAVGDIHPLAIAFSLQG